MGNEMKIETKFGVIERSRKDFGYGQVWFDGAFGKTKYCLFEIVYQDSCSFLSFETVSAFERWVDEQNEYCGGAYDRICK